MDRHSIVAYLRAEIDVLTKALEALDGAITTHAGRQSRKPRTHHLTPEGRRRLSEMMTRRWAERRKRVTGSPTISKKAGNGQHRRRKNRLTPAGRRRLSEMMKKRWAERRKKTA